MNTPETLEPRVFGHKPEASPRRQTVETPGVGASKPGLCGGLMAATPNAICNYCGKPALLVSGAEIYRHRPDLKHLSFWLCSPCDAYVGCHKNSNAIPLSRLANKKLRSWKQWAHAAFDPLWKSGDLGRREAYSWLADQMGIAVNDCHIGMFDEAQCERVVQIMKRRNA